MDTIKLYKYVPGHNTGSWELASSNARPSFYDAKDDSSTKAVHDWFLEVNGDIDTRVDQDLAFVFEVSTRRVTFNANGHVWALKFPTDAQHRAFSEQLNDRVFYNTYGVANDLPNRRKELGADYADLLFSAANTFAEPMEADGGRDVPSAVERLQAERAKEYDEDEPTLGITMGGGESSYLLRASGFDVLRNTPGRGVEGGNVSFSLTPSFTPSKPTFTPSKVLLAQGERRMNLLTHEAPTSLHHADIETGKIVSTFTFQKDAVTIPIKDIVADTKSSQMEEASTFLGLDRSRLCRWDLREARGVVQESPVVVTYTGGKDYSRGTNFTCMATSGEGYVAVGSQDGKIRLYSNKTLTRANTAIPGLGAPITSIDVTYDGKWVLATTERYLMLVKTAYTTDKGEVATGFASRMGSHRNMPLLLRLRPEDLALTAGTPFAKGKFTWVTEQGQTERWIAASCGKFTVHWNFHKVKTAVADGMSFGGLPTNTAYLLTATAKEERVVDTGFVHQKYSAGTPGHDTSLVVLTPHSVFNMAS
jgi:WD40 repeat protein